MSDRGDARKRQYGLGSLLVVVGLVVPLVVSCASTGAGAGPSAAPEAAAKPTAAPDARAEVGANGLPTPRALLQRFTAATGGEQRHRAVSAMTLKGAMELASMGIKGTLEVIRAAPNQMVMKAELAGVGTTSNGYNGEVGWSENPMSSPSVLSGEQLDQAIREADFYHQLRYDQHYPTQETVELTQFGSEPAYKLRLVDKKGREVIEYYGQTTGLLVGREGKRLTEMGEVDTKFTIGEYRNFEGLLLPATTVMSVMGMEIKQTVDTVSFAPIDPAAFEPPAAVKTLLQPK